MPKVEHRVEGAVREIDGLGVRGSRFDVQPFRGRARLEPFQQGGHVVDRRDPAAATRRCEGSVAVSGREVDDVPTRSDVDGLAEGLADNLQRRADDGVVAGGPGDVLLVLERLEVDGRGRGRGHDVPPAIARPERDASCSMGVARVGGSTAAANVSPSRNGSSASAANAATSATSASGGSYRWPVAVARSQP